MWSGKRPSYSHLKVFGYEESYAHIPKELCQKLEPKSHKCIFLCYGFNGEMGYHLWHLDSCKVSDFIFVESKMHKKPIKIVEVRRFIFQEDGHENVGEQQQFFQRQEEARVREDE